MAEGRWFVFHEALRSLGKASYDFSDAGATKWQMLLLGSEATALAAAPNLEISTTGSLSFTSCKNDAQGGDITKSLTTVWTATTGGILKFVHDNKVFTATTGNQFSAKYAVLLYSGVATPFAIFQLSTTRVVASQITVACPADGVFRMANDENLSSTVTMA